MNTIVQFIKLIIIIIRTIIEFFIYPGPPFKSWEFPLFFVFKLLKSKDSIFSLETRRKIINILDFEPPDGIKYEKAYIPKKHINLATTILNEYYKTEFDIDDRIMDVEWVKNENSNDTDIIIHFHGGGFTTGSYIVSRNITVNLSLNTNSDVICPSYSLAPEYPFPYGLIDCLATYLYFSQKLGYRNVVLSGDSAGGYFCVTINYLLKFKNISIPCGTIMFSPCLDNTFTSDSFIRNGKYDILPFQDLSGPKFIESMEQLIIRVSDPHYLPAIIERGNYYCDLKYYHDDLNSIMKRKNFPDYPPTLIQTGEIERLVDDSIGFANQLNAYYKTNKHAYLRLELYKEVPHCFINLSFSPVAKLALERASKFVIGCFESSLLFIPGDPYIFIAEVDGSFSPFKNQTLI